MKRAVFLILVTTAGIAALLVARDLIPWVSVSPDSLPAILTFFRGPHGLWVTVTGILLMALLVYADFLVRLLAGLFRVVLAPVFDEQKDVNRRMTRQMADTEKKINETEQALGNFSKAISHYAEHLSSHTSAIQGLAAAAHELKEGAAVQNRVLLNLVQSAEERLARQEELKATLKMAAAATEKPEKAEEEPTLRKAPPSYRDLHPEITTTMENEESGYEVANLVEAMVMPYYTALHQLEPEKSNTDQASDDTKKATEAVVVPLFRTLYREETDQPQPEPEQPDTGIKHPSTNYRQHHQQAS